MPPPSDNALQVFYGTLPVVGAILLANWNNNKRLDDLNKRIGDVNKRIDDFGTSLNKRMDDLALQMTTGFAEVKASIARLETRVSDLEKGTHLLR
jgi:archaellum component FlaC